jgi:hypothetical protein
MGPPGREAGSPLSADGAARTLRDAADTVGTALLQRRGGGGARTPISRLGAPHYPA